MNAQKYPMTVAGELALRDELEQLKKVERPAVIAAIAEARAHGDLKENAEYHAAREKQGFVEGRIGDIEAKLSLAVVIDVTKLPKNGKVVFGVTVDLEHDGQKTTYKLVGEDEADIHQGKISVTSPVARALIGKEEGDEVTIKTPSGEVTYLIDAVHYI
jgi:transcription elongation factor GreA